MSTGMIEHKTLADDPSQTYYLYVPDGGGIGAKLFVSVHGISRNAEEHAALFAPFAEQYGVVMVVPLFDSSRFPDYNCLGREGQGQRSDYALERIVADAGRLTGANTDAIYLFGYSAGGQFAHRFVMAWPERIKRCVIGAAGWYTFPDPVLAYPQGIGAFPDLPGVHPVPERFLQVPTCIVVGELDTERTASLNQEPEIDAQQGLNRIERGERWARAMRTAAEARGIANEYRFATLPGSTHNFAKCMKLGRMGERVFEYLFEADRRCRITCE
ncbi:S9 family peptidase [Paenibacillus allorhizosphaerae]|uniref:Alpha/beta hydrolase n=1 Tax=Paenibacillus allorhizosphaerae TaxID=2849866 RepID=A0ABM8VEE4_9BACL|nr:S9 family peptidase [Paenibacillus allorhizosphaerae]CAG7630660.1 hypothetical protein PAECIP111802_01661 [Paenibacillus allorhizosphaerae]